MSAAIIDYSSPDNQILSLVKVMHDYVVPRRLCREGCAFVNVDVNALITLFEAASAIVQKHVVTHSWDSAAIPSGSVRSTIRGAVVVREVDYPPNESITEHTANRIRHNYPKCLNELAIYANEGCFGLLTDNRDITWKQVAARKNHPK